MRTGFKACSCVHNREHDFNFIPLKIHTNGSVSKDELEGAARDLNLKNKTVITDPGASMKAFLEVIDGVNHLIFKSKDVKKGIFADRCIHNNYVNNTMMLAKNWLKEFFGVSTKYIWNYLKWFRFIRLFSIFNIREMVGYTVEDKQAYPRYKGIFNDYVAFVYV